MPRLHIRLVRCVILLFWLAGAAPLVAAAESAALDWDAWAHLPVFHRGRMMPLDTFARDAVETICGREQNTFSLEGAALNADGSIKDPASAAELTGARELFPDGRPRRFSPAELLFSWAVEPEKWEYVPFLRADLPEVRRLLADPDQVRHQMARLRQADQDAAAPKDAAQLRQEVTGLPLEGRDGRPLKYVSPRQLGRAVMFRQRLGEIESRLQAAAGRKPMDLVGVDKKVKELADGYALFRLLSFNPTTAARESRGPFEGALTHSVQLWVQLNETLEQLHKFTGDAEGEKLVQATTDATRKLAQPLEKGDYKLADVEPLVNAYRQAAQALATHYQRHTPQLNLDPSNAGDVQRAKVLHASLVRRAREFAQSAADAHLALYDTGHSLRLVPAINPAALSRNRDSSDNSQPWLDVGVMLFGSPQLLAGYPQSELGAVRMAYGRAKAAYIERNAPQRPELFAAAMADFAATLRALATAIEPLRESLPAAESDDATVAATAYPAAGSTRLEVHYNRVDPFFWSWMINLAAAICLGLSFGILRKTMFWLALGVLLAGQLLAVYGFALRARITGWVPVANMFETVMYVGLIVALLGVWFTMLPLLWPGLKRAWALTGLRRPLSPPVAAGDAPTFTPPGGGQIVLALLRTAMTAAMFYALTMVPYGHAGRSYFSLWPRTDVGSAIPTVDSLLTWGVGLCVLLPAVWYTPRVLLTLLLGIGTVPASMRGAARQRALAQVYDRQPFLLVGAFMAFAVAFIGFWSPIWHKDISPMTVVLRDNFWLTIHVLTITASYAAGTLALGLGNIALAYYLCGRYRDPSQPTAGMAGHRPADGYAAPAATLHRRPPEVCNTLGAFIYKAMQVAVVLLAAGTIFGALWADVSWGRFWSWDNKEVWALASLLVYLTILHGRFAGWLSNFGLAVGTVIGASAIVMAWYGVNFWLPMGRHSYATGAGGAIWVGLAVLANWLFALAAAARYTVETRVPSASAAVTAGSLRPTAGGAP